MSQGRHFSSRPDRGRPTYRKGGGRFDRDDRPRREPQLTLDPALDAPKFAELGLPFPLTNVLANLEITEPFPIQAATIPDALAGRDVLGRGRTGSGKTLAFGLPMLTRLMGEKSKPKYPRALVLVPTRELAMQVKDALQPLAQQAKLSMQLVIGGSSYHRQIEGLSRGADIVVATPGRLKDLIDQRACDLSEVGIAVLDEADQMADMGFLEEVDELMQLVAPGGQRLLFSATLDRGIDTLVKKHLKDPVEHATDPETASVTTMTHHLFVVDAREKPGIVHQIASRPGRTIAFARTQLGVEQWAEELNRMGIPCEALHGGKTQGARNKALGRFRNGEVQILVATDVAARGIHIDGIDLVLQIDPPRDPKDYLHRAGRTARAGATGTVVLVSTTRQIRSSEQMLKAAGVEAIDSRVRSGDAVIADITGGTGEIAPRAERRPHHLREEVQVRRETTRVREERFHEDGAARREARPRTAPVDDRRFRERDDRFGRRDERPPFRSRDDRGFAPREDRGGYAPRNDRFGGRDDRFGRRDERPPFRSRDDRGFAPREDRGGYAPRNDRFGGRDDRGGYAPRNDRFGGRDDRGGYAPREDRGGYAPRNDRGNDRGGYAPRNDRRDDRGGYAPRSDRRDERPGGRGGDARRSTGPSTGGPKKARWTAADRKQNGKSGGGKRHR